MTGVRETCFFTMMHGMQTRSSDENSVCLSVCLSVGPSVCQTRDLWQKGRKIFQIFIPYERSFRL